MHKHFPGMVSLGNLDSSHSVLFIFALKFITFLQVKRDVKGYSNEDRSQKGGQREGVGTKSEFSLSLDGRRENGAYFCAQS